MLTWVCIFLGAGAGGLLRHVLGSALQANAPAWVPGVFPSGTLAVNISGCFAIGVLAAVQGGWLAREEVRLGLIVGVLGGYTTFSSFSLEVLRLFETGHGARAAVYVLLSNALGLGAAWGGMGLTRWVTR